MIPFFLAHVRLMLYIKKPMEADRRWDGKEEKERIEPMGQEGVIADGTELGWQVLSASCLVKSELFVLGKFVFFVVKSSKS